MSAEIMSQFGSLSNPHIDQRISAATSIVSLLNPKTKGETDQDSDLMIDDADFQYTLKRLIRGLASPTVGARLGFAVALTEILKNSEGVSAQSVYDLLKSSTAKQTGTKPSEERDLLLGKLFGIKAIVTSGLIFRSTSTSSHLPHPGSSNPQLELWTSMIEDLTSLPLKRSWLAESAGWVLSCGMLQTLMDHPPPKQTEQDSVPWKNSALERLVDKIFMKNKSWTLEKLAIGLLLQRYDISIDWPSITSEAFMNPTILSSENDDQLYHFLISPFQFHDPSELKSGTPNPSSSVPTIEPSTQPHFVHSVILSCSPHVSGTFSASKLYARLFENYYFSPDESNNPTRKSQGFNLLSQLLVSTEIVALEKPRLLTPSTIYTLMVQLAGRDCLLHKLAQSVMTTLLDQIRQSSSETPTLASAFATQIRQTLSDFDQRSRTKTLETILTMMTAHEVQSWVHELIKALEFGRPICLLDHPNSLEPDSISTSSDSITDDKFRERTLSQLCNIIRNRAITKSTYCTRAILHSIISCGFFGHLNNLWPSSSEEASTSSNPKKKKKKKNDPIKNGSVEEPLIDLSHSAFFELCRSRFYTCLSDLSSQTLEVDRSSEKDLQELSSSSKVGHPPTTKQHRWTREALDIIHQHVRQGHRVLVDDKHQSDSQRMTELDRLRKIGIESIKIIDGQNDTDDGVIDKRESLKLLCESILLMSYDDHDDILEALGLLERLQSHRQRLIHGDPSRTDPNQNSSSSLSSIDVLLETLVYLLSWPIAFLRNVVEQVFVNFADRIGVSSLQILIDQMIPSTTGLEDLEAFEPDEPMPDVADGSVVDGEELSDESSSDDDGDEGQSLSGSSLGSIDEAFRDEVAAALANALDRDTPEDQETGSDASSELMNDEEMLALDANLAALFQRRTGKANAKAQNTQDLHLRLKLSELFARFVKLRPDPMLVARLISPMLNLIRKPASGEEELKNKVFRILQDALRQSNKKSNQELKLSPDHTLTVEAWLMIFKRIFTIANTAQSSDVSKISIQAITWLIELSQTHIPEIDLSDRSSKVVGEIVKVYEQALNKFCTKKNAKLQPKFFSDVFTKFPSFGWNLRQTILDLASDSATLNDYRRIQVFTMLQDLMKAYSSSSPDHSSELLEFMPAVQTNLLAILKRGISSSSDETTTSSNDKKMTTARVKELLKICSTLISLTVKSVSSTTEEQVTKIWSSSEILELSDLARKRSDLGSSTALDQLFNQLLKTLAARDHQQEQKIEDDGSNSKRKASKLKNETPTADDLPDQSRSVKRKKANKKRSSTG